MTSFSCICNANRSLCIPQECRLLYVALPDTWFDVGTRAEMLDDYGDGMGLFLGIKDGAYDEEICRLDEFRFDPWLG